MWPWGHAAAGYLVYTLWVRSRFRHPPAGPATLALAVGTQFPDLVDKPLAWTLGVSPSGRAGAHSLLVAAPILAALWVGLPDRYRRGLWGAFAAGYLVHLGTDVLYPVVNGDFATLGFLLWPVTPLPALSESTSIAGHFLAMELTPTLAFELVLFAVATAVWFADGRPGVTSLGRLVTRPFGTDSPPVSEK
jgi:hypothetical protein